jgi:hypothetical protein
LEFADPRAERVISHGIRFHWAIDDDPEHVVWLIDGFIPAHCLIIVAGREGAGKSTLAARIIAVATRGELTGEPVKCLVLGTEDGWRSRWIPRLHASGADLAKVSRDPELITVDDDGNEVADLISIADPVNLARLATAMRAEGIGLLYLDHLGDALAIGTDHNAYGQVTAALKTINRWANANEVTVIGGWHLTKGAGVVRDKVIGSVGFRTSARCVALVAEDQEAGHRLLAIDKCNDLDVSKTPARVFRIAESTVEVKGSTFSTTAAGPLSLHPGDCGRDVVQQLIDEGSATDDPDDRDNRQDMADFIRDYVTEHGGEALAKDATAALHARFGDVHTREVGKARRKAGVSSRREGFGKGARYLWRLMESMQSRSRERDSMDSMGDSMDRAGRDSVALAGATWGQNDDFQEHPVRTLKCADCGTPIAAGFGRCPACIHLMKGGAP